MRVFLSVLELVGASLVFIGVAILSLPIALIVAGLVLVAVASTLSAPREGSRVSAETGTGRRPRSVA